MTFAHKVARITINGTMATGLEQWSTGFYMGVDSQDATAPTESFLNFVNTSWKTFFQHTDHQIASSYLTTEIRGALLNVDGSTDLATVKHHYVQTPYGGGSLSSAHPPQVAVVATLLNSVPRGIGTKGRMYLPGITTPVGDDGHFSTSQANRLSLGLKTFFDACNGVFDAPGRVINASKGTKASGYSDGINRSITAVKVGNVFDTQRRRRNQLTEVYSINQLVAGTF